MSFNRNVLYERLILLCALWFLVCFIGACKNQTPYQPEYVAGSATKKVLLFGVPNQAFFDLTSDLIIYLNHNVKDAEVHTVACFNMKEYLTKLDQRYFEFTIINGADALNSNADGYRIVGKVSDDDSYRGVIFVNREAGIKDVADLKNKIIASPGEEALAGHKMPVYFLQKNGLTINRDYNIKYTSSFESTIMNVYLGKCSAGFSWKTVWQKYLENRPEITSKLALKWETTSLPNVALIFRNDMDPEIKKELIDALLSMDKNEEGQNALHKLGFNSFEQADSNTYKPVKIFMNEYNAVIKKAY